MNENENILLDIQLEAQEACLNLIPKKSKDVYDKEFSEFILWKDRRDDNINENAEIQRKKDIDKIGKHLKEIKTEREICLDRITENLTAEPAKTESEQVNMVLDTGKLPYQTEVCEYGVKPLSKVCPYEVKISERPLDEKLPCPVSEESYTVKYPKTREQELQEYYDDVLKRHEEACLKAAEYKKYVECLPGTISTDYNPQLSKKVIISKEDRPQPHKDSPCVKKTVRFIEPDDKCQQMKDDVCGLTVPTTQCDCTQYRPC